MTLPAFQTGVVETQTDAVKPYVLIEGGPLSIVVVPGAADGLRTCTDVAVYLAWFYRQRVKNCRLLILSRREPLPAGFSIERHAADMLHTVEHLNFGPAVWE